MASAIILAAPSLWLRDGAFEAACAAARFRDDTDPDLAAALRDLADQVLGASTDEWARRALRAAPAALLEEIAGATTDNDLAAAITAAATPGDRAGVPGE